MHARPGYAALMAVTRDSDAEPAGPLGCGAAGAGAAGCERRGAATTAPPTGTMKFLSVDCTTASTRPRRHAAQMAWHRAGACTPYALFTTWPTPCASHSCASSTRLSAARGAKQEEVDRTHTTWSAPTSPTARLTASMSVRSWSPSSVFSTTINSRPAASTAFTHVFWSQRGQTTYLGA